MRKIIQKLWLGIYLALIGTLVGCGSISSSKAPGEGGRLERVGTYHAYYDAESGDLKITMVDKKNGRSLQDPLLLLDYNNTTGLSTCAIRDTNVTAPDEPNYCMGLVDPDSCSTDYNSVTKTLSFYARMENKTSSTYYNDARYQFANGAADHNVTYRAPFYFKLAGVWWDDLGINGLVQTVNTNLPGADCGGDGLQLEGAGPPVDDDVAANGYFDCIYPDVAEPVATDSKDPGWDFTPFTEIGGSVDGDMVPGENSGCVLFMQYQLSQNESFHIAFDLLAVRQTVTTPAAPVISTPADESYVNTATINITGTCIAGGTVYVEGGASGINPPSIGCPAGNYTLSNVPLITETENQFYVYQVTGAGQSGAAVLTITHDTTAPTVLSTTPANGEQGVSNTTNYTVTFSESILYSSLSTGTSCNPFNGTFGMCNGTTHVPGTLSPTSNASEFTFTPTTKPIASGTTFTFNLVGGGSGVRDLAGNAITGSTPTFTTAAAGLVVDNIPPFIRNMVPADSATLSPGTDTYSITFSEPINPSSIVGNVVDAACQLDDNQTGNLEGNPVPNVTVFEYSGCGPATQPMCGSTSLSADGLTATFTLGGSAPTNCQSPPLTNNSCYRFWVSSCVEDLAGNALVSTNTHKLSNFAGSPADPQGGRTSSVNKMPIFFTATDSASFTGDTADLSTTLSDLSSVANLLPGMTITGTGIPTGTRIVSITSPTLTMSKAAIATGNNVSVSATSNPALVHVGPILAQTGVFRRTYPFMILDKAIDPSTVIGDYFYMNISGDTTQIPLALSIDPFLQLVTFQPTSSLNSTTNYLMTATGNVADISGNLMTSPQTSNYTTGAAIDNGSSPSVVSVSPAAGSTASICPLITVDFSEPMKPTTLNGGTVYVNLPASTVFPADQFISDDLTRVTLRPDTSLPKVFPFTATTTNNNATLTNVSSVSGLVVGMALAGTNIPANTTILNIPSANSITMSANASGGAAGVSVTATTQFRARRTAGSATLTEVFSPGGLINGRSLSGTGIPGGRTISSIDVTTPRVIMSGNGSGTFNNVTVTASGTFTANRTAGSTVLTNVSSMAGLALGMSVTGTGIPGGTTIISLGTSTVTMSAAATSGTGTSTTVTASTTFIANVQSAGSNRLNVPRSIVGLVANTAITGTGIAANTTISSFPSSESITMTNNATGNGLITAAATGREVQLVVSTGATDLGGTALAAASTTSFVTTSDTTVPTITSAVIPLVGGTTPINASFALFFSEPMDRSTLNATNIRTYYNAPPITNCNRTIHPSLDGRFVVSNCSGNMNTGTNYTLSVNAIRDYNNTLAGAGLSCEASAGNLASGIPATYNFTTSATEDVTAFTVSSVSPADRAVIATLGTSPTVTFNKPIDPRSVLESSLFIMTNTGQRVNSVLSFSTNLLTVTINPVSDLTNDSVYYIVGTNALRDLMGNAYNGFGGELSTDDPGVLRSCFETGSATCPTPD